MSDSGAIISVYAQFPKDPKRMEEEAYISEPTSWEWVQCLKIPVSVFNRLSFWPKHNQWIRYAMSAILGAEGHISNAEEDDTPVDYDLELLPAESIALYYHTPIEQKRRQFPVDPELNNTRITSSSQTGTSHRQDFRNAIIRRDGSCVVTGRNVLHCDAAHLLPHSKGSDYIKPVTEGRGGPVIGDIDDVRNGLLLDKNSHSLLGTSLLAFLRLPNFAMDSDAPRCIAHSFDPSNQVLGVTAERHIVESGSAIRVSQDNWPPGCLFDITYGSAVFRLFGVKASYGDAFKGWKNKLYVGGATTAAQRDASQHAQEKDQKAERTREANNARDERCRKRVLGGSAPDMFDVLLFFQNRRLPFYLWEKRQQEAEERQLAEIQKQAKEKVAEWQAHLVC